MSLLIHEGIQFVKSHQTAPLTCALFSMFIMLKYNALKSPHKEYSADTFAV